MLHYEQSGAAERRVLDAAFRESRDRAEDAVDAGVGPATRRALEMFANHTLHLDAGAVRLRRHPDAFLGAAVIRRVYGIEPRRRRIT